MAPTLHKEHQVYDNGRILISLFFKKNKSSTSVLIVVSKDDEDYVWTDYLQCEDEGNSIETEANNVGYE
jgi:hypothetical protein